jgi:uncharacterized protein
VATLTSTELGASGRYINFGSAAALDDLGSQTIIVYARPTGAGGGDNAYLYSKGGSTGLTGPRLFIQHNSGSPKLLFGANSANSSGKPYNNSVAVAGAVAYNAWQYFQVCWDGTINAHGIKTYINAGTSPTGVSNDNGDGAITSDAANNVYLMNREDLARNFVGDYGWCAVWDRELSNEERATVRSTGPLDVPSGLVFLAVNQADLGPHELPVVGRSEYVAGALPPNTALGGSNDATVSGGTGTGAGAGSGGNAIGGTDSPNGEASGGTGAGTGTGSGGDASGGAQTLSMMHAGDGFNTHPTNSTVTNPSSTTPTVLIVPRTQHVVTPGPWVEDKTVWRNFQFKLTGAQGKTPSFRVSILSYTVTIFSAWRPWYSYDNVNWTQWPSATTLNGNYREFGGVTFTADTVYIGFMPGYPIARAKSLIDWLVANHPDYIHPLRSTGPDWVAQTLPAQTDELGNTVPAQPFYTYGIWDRVARPDDGNPKRTCLLTCGMHPGETVADWMFEGFVKFCVGEDPAALLLRKNAELIIYPKINPPGSYGGHWRGQWEPTALTKNSNRDYSNFYGVTPFQMPSSRAVRDSLLLDAAGRHITCALDFHGQQDDPSGQPAAYWFLDSTTDATYAANWQARMRVYNSSYTRQAADLRSSLQTWIHDTYSCQHSYTPEAYEQRLCSAGTADYTAVGEHLAKALAATFTASPAGEARFIGKSAVLDFQNAPADGPLSASLWSGVPGHGGALLSAEKTGSSGGMVALDASAADGSSVFVLLTDDGETAGTTRSFAATVDVSVST